MPSMKERNFSQYLDITSLSLTHCYLATFTYNLSFMLNFAFIFCSLDNSQHSLSLSFSLSFENKFSFSVICFNKRKIFDQFILLTCLPACLLVPHTYVMMCVRQAAAEVPPLNLFVFIFLSSSYTFQTI